ncbi:MAG: carboxypeptidase-like regulatory domain-containing protein [Cellulophaga sp.]
MGVKKAFFFLFILISLPLLSQEIVVKGKIIDSETNKTIAFVNIGIESKNIGTISNLKGRFRLQVSENNKNNSILISHVNYEPKEITFRNENNIIIYLQPKTTTLDEVVVSYKKRKKRKRKIGVKSYNPLLWLRATSKENDIVENAQRINIPDKRVRVKYINLYLRRGFDADSSYVRVNFYASTINKSPGKKIVFKNILIHEKIKKGWLKIDVTKEYIYLEEDFFVGIEFIPNFKKPQQVFLGCILTKGKGYQRGNSQGSWTKLNGGSTINVELEY